LPDQDIITVIDDDASARVATDRLIRSLGWRVRSFASCEEFLASARIGETRCLVSDVQMARVDGLELQRRLVEQGYRIPIIFMTAFPNEKEKARALASGAIGFLTKPLDAPTLTDCIETALRQNDRD
jgi:FixJ family two-component response regulator